MTQELGTQLLQIAAGAIGERLALRPAPLTEAAEPDRAQLEAPGAVFVTLKLAGELRGCMGTLEAYRPLREDCHKNALASAFHDPRFAPLTAPEFPLISLEVSLLSEPTRLPLRDEEDARAQLARLRPGVILRWGAHRATFLPQVWAELPEVRAFLRHLKRKAGLTDDFWDPACEVWTYHVQHWEAPPWG